MQLPALLRLQFGCRMPPTSACWMARRMSLQQPAGWVPRWRSRTAAPEQQRPLDMVWAPHLYIYHCWSISCVYVEPMAIQQDERSSGNVFKSRGLHIRGQMRVQLRCSFAQLQSSSACCDTGNCCRWADLWPAALCCLHLQDAGIAMQNSVLCPSFASTVPLLANLHVHPAMAPPG